MNNRAKPVHTSSAPSLSPPEQIEIPRAENPNPMPRGIAKYGRGAKAWISEDALRQQLERQKYHSDSLQATGEDSIIHQSITPGSDTLTPSTAYISVADIPFQVTNGGSKLVRTTGMLKFRLCKRRTRSDFDRHLDPHEAHPERGSSQRGHLQALEEWQPRPCCSRAPWVRSQKQVYDLQIADKSNTGALREAAKLNSADNTLRPVPLALTPDLIKFRRSLLSYTRKV